MCGPEIKTPFEDCLHELKDLIRFISISCPINPVIHIKEKSNFFFNCAVAHKNKCSDERSKRKDQFATLFVLTIDAYVNRWPFAYRKLRGSHCAFPL